MNVLVADFLPLLVFVIVDIFAGVKWGVIAAIAFALFGTVWEFYTVGSVDSTTWLALGLIIGLGLLTLRLNDPRFFKFQPVVLGLAFALILAYFQFFDVPLMVKLLPKVAHLVPNGEEIVQSELWRERFALVSGQMIGVFVAHAALVAYAALRLSSVKWVLMRGLGFYVLMGIVFAYDILVKFKN